MVHEPNQETHFLLVTFPGQGHINPSLEFAKRVVRTGARVTFVTTIYGQQKMVKNQSLCPNGLSFAPFSDGYDDGFKPNIDVEHFMVEFRRCGFEALSGLVENFAKEGCPVTCLIYTLLLPWAAEVARKYKLSSALLWIQPAAVFDIYYYYFSDDYHHLIINGIDDTSSTIKLPGLPLLKSEDLPSFFCPSNPYVFGLNLFREQFKLLSEESKSFQVLVNTYDELEPEALKAVDKFKLVGIGSLIPSAFLGGKDPSDKDHSNDYTEWLDAKDQSSTVYVSFGSIAVLTNKQMEELARAFVDSGRPFLWVIRSSGHGSRPQVQDNDEEEKYMEILKEEHNGMIVPWCSQVDVLNHPSVGCFVTHCGWSSTLETLAMGVPVVAFPQWTDQGTNAKLIEDVWKIGVRVRPNEEDKMVTSKEIIRCMEEVMEGKKGEEFRKNAKKWKDSSREAVREGGSSDRNLGDFVEEIRRQVHF